MMRRLMLVTIAAGAIGLPYLASSSGGLWNSVSSQFTSPASDAKSASPTAGMMAGTPRSVAFASTPATPSAPAAADAAPAPIEGYSARDLGEVLRFDISPQWVMARWPRVTASLAELDLQGYRVPLVTGTRQDDLAGSLTYYFDKEHRVVRIAFRGTTGDPRRIIALATTRFNFVVAAYERSQPDPLPGQVERQGSQRNADPLGAHPEGRSAADALRRRAGDESTVAGRGCAAIVSTAWRRSLRALAPALPTGECALPGGRVRSVRRSRARSLLVRAPAY